MNFKQQAEQFMLEIASRKSDPVRSNTLHVYRSLLDARILPCIGKVEMADVNNMTAKMLRDRLAEVPLRPATINLAVWLMTKIVNSAWDEKGNRLYPVTWDWDFIKLPKLIPADQKTPIAPAGALQEAISQPNGEVQALVALLGGTGLRIGEALSLMVGPDDGKNSFWDPQAGTLTVRTTMVKGKIQMDTKTKAGTRTVDLDPHLNSFLRTVLPNPDGLVFRTPERTLRRYIGAHGIHGFHSMRRFRITHLQGANVPTTLTKFWSGHAAGDVTERYTKFGSKIEERKDWSERAGLGFQL